jgi:ABC-type transport system involved in cytochrome bd biosynthesis fused ATPase/permease subunit
MFGINPAETLEMLIKADAGSVLGTVANFISAVFALVVVCLSIMTILVSLVFGLMILLRPLFIRTNFSEFYQSYKQKYCQKVEWK